jgi:hypothetical protein
VITEEFQLGFQDFLNGALDQSLAHIDGQGLDGIEIDAEPGTFVAVSAPGDNFPPPVRHVAQIGQILGLTLGERHGVFVLELGEQEKMGKSP